MLRTRIIAAAPLAALLAAAACDNAGEHGVPAENADVVSGADPRSRQDSATVGQQIPSAYPPVGTTNTVPPDSNPSPTTPGGTPPAGRDTGRATQAF